MGELVLGNREYVIVASVLNGLKSRINSYGRPGVDEYDNGYLTAIEEIEQVLLFRGIATGPCAQWANNPFRLSDRIPISLLHPSNGQTMEVPLKLGIAYTERLVQEHMRRSSFLQSTFVNPLSVPNPDAIAIWDEVVREQS